jgi:hypothetical protein
VAQHHTCRECFRFDGQASHKIIDLVPTAISLSGCRTCYPDENHIGRPALLQSNNATVCKLTEQHDLCRIESNAEDLLSIALSSSAFDARERAFN